MFDAGTTLFLSVRRTESSCAVCAKRPAIVAEALAVYLGMKALDEAQAERSLSEDEALQLAYDELRALRQERRGAA